jgi:hypothetical protein
MGYGFTHLGADVEEFDGEELIESSSAPGGGEGRGEVGEPGSVVAAWPTSPSPSPPRRVPSLSPRKRAERAKLRDG